MSNRMTDDTTSASAQADFEAWWETGAGIRAGDANGWKGVARAAWSAAIAASAPTGQGAGLTDAEIEGIFYPSGNATPTQLLIARGIGRAIELVIATRSAGDGQAVAWIYTPKDYPEIKILDKTRWTNSDWVSNYIEQPLYLAPPPAASVRDAQEETGVCPRCDGSGAITVLSDNGPDAYDIETCCPHCEGTGGLVDAYKGVCKLLVKQHADNLRRMSDACEKVRAQVGWRPIATAPKDGTPLIGLVGDRACTIECDRCTDGEPSGKRWTAWVEVASGSRIPREPSHWMPMPKEPEGAQHDE